MTGLRIQLKPVRAHHTTALFLLPGLTLAHQHQTLRNGPSLTVAITLQIARLGLRLSLAWNPPDTALGPTPIARRQDMHWQDAPDWATHIVGDRDNPDHCFWAEDVNGLMCDAISRRQARTGFAIDDEEPQSHWTIYATRPRAKDTQHP